MNSRITRMWSRLTALGKALLPALLLALCGGAQAADDFLFQEVISREVGIHVGGISTPDIQEIISREVSIFIENGQADHEVISREVSIVVDAPGNPPQVTGYTVTPSPTGTSVVLNWSNYNQWAVKDVSYYRIYRASAPFSDVSAMTPFTTVPGETLTATLAGLPEYQDHYIAIVAVDGLDNANPVVIYSAAYILTKEVISREVGLFIGEEPVPPYHEVVSREVSIVVNNPGPPAPIADAVMTTSPDNSAVTLDWSAYNQWAQRDVESYWVYYSDTFFTDLSNVPFVEVPGETFTRSFTGLVPNVDHYFVIVPVDGGGAYDMAFSYNGAYWLMPEVVSRELGIFVGEDTPGSTPVSGGNFSFESPVTSTFIYYGGMDSSQKAAFVWATAGNGANGPALFKNGSAWNFSSVPDGVQAVSLQGDSAISQTVSFASPGMYILSWKAASRSGQVNPYVVKLNGTVISPAYSTGDTNWQPVSLMVNIAAEGSQTLTFAALNTGGGDNSVGIDAVSLALPATGLPIGAPTYHELISREISMVVPDAAIPAAVTGVASAFDVDSSLGTYRALDLDWTGYDEVSQRDVVRYRVYVDTGFFSDVTGMTPFAFVADGSQFHTLAGFFSDQIYYVAVVAEDALGQFNPVVYARSGQASNRAAWRRQFFTDAQLGNPALEASLWGDYADADGDGVGNLLEWSLGGDVFTGSLLSSAGTGPLLPVQGFDAVGADYFYDVTFRRQLNADYEGLSYGIELSQDLQNWFSTNTPGAGWTAAVELPPQPEAGMPGFELATLRLTTPFATLPSSLFSRLRLQLSESIVTSTSSAVMDSEPLRYFRLDDLAGSTAAADAMGGAAATLAGGVTLTETPHARRGYVAHFDGQPGTFINTGLFHPGDDVTVEAWIKLDAGAPMNAFHAIAARWDGSFEVDIGADEHANFVVRNAANTIGLATSSLPIIRGRWHHVVGVFVGGVVTVWLDGVQGSSENIGGVLRDAGPTPDRVLIGATRNGTSSSFNFHGFIDEVAVYGRALNAAEVGAHFDAGR